MATAKFKSETSGSLSRMQQLYRAWIAGMKSLGTQPAQAPFLARVPRRVVAFRQAVRRLLRFDADAEVGSFDPLTPARLNGRSYDRYRAELQRALRLPKVRNIAVTGSYGAGKSSFIQSFAADHPEYNFCFVSLATFTQGADEKIYPSSFNQELNKAESAEIDTAVDPIERIEASIVQQLLYSVKDRSIPQTRLKRINHVHAGVAALYAVFAVAVGVALIRVFGLPAGLAGVAKIFPIAQFSDAEPTLCILVLIFAAGLTAQRILSSVLGFRLQGITVKGVTLAHSNVASVLHKQLDEIVYLFERNKKDVVLIEDLDRFRDSSPFTRLREINFILNSSPSIRRPIHFVYMIRDDVFSAADRVKFFDYVIPIISVINTDNSKQKMLDMMSERGWAVSDKPSADLVEAVSYYVDDMRQLVNILNEYDLFRDVVSQQQKLNVNKIFSAVVTKCLFPREYADLLKGRGEIHGLIGSYAEWSEERVRFLRGSIAELEAQVSGNAFALANSERELRALLWMAASDRYPSEPLEAVTPPSGVRMSFSEFVANDLVGSQTHQGDYFELHYRLSNYSVEFRELTGQGSGSIGARLAAARGISNGALQQLSVMRQKLAAGRYAALSQAIIDSEFISHVAAKANKLSLGPVGYFIANGFLGEDYFDYSGHFYAGSVSLSDKSVILRVKSGEMVPVDTRVDEPREVLKRLNIGDLGGGKGMISALVQYLFSEQVSPADAVSEKLAAVYREAGLHPDRASHILLDGISDGTVGEQVEFLLGQQPATLLGALQDGFPCGESPWREMILGLILSDSSSDKRNIGDELSMKLSELVENISDGDAFAAAVIDESVARSWVIDSRARIDRLQGQPTPVAIETLLRLGIPRLNLNNLVALTAHKRSEIGSVEGKFSIGSLKAATGALKNWLMGDPASLLRALFEQEGEIIESEADVMWALSAVDDEALRVRIVERLRFTMTSIDSLDNSLWGPSAKALNIKATWSNISKLVADASIEELGAVWTAVLDSDDYLSSLSSDVESLGDLDEEDVDFMLASMLKLPEDDMTRMALFLSESGAFGLASTGFDPEISDRTVQALAETFYGQWMNWLLDKIAEVDYGVAVNYLASCANDPGFGQSERKIAADLAVRAAIEIAGLSDQKSFVSTCFTRVDDWSAESAKRACWILQALAVADPSSAADVLAVLVGGSVLSVADVESSAALIAVLVPLVQWTKVKAALLVASGGFFMPLQNGEALRITNGDSEKALAHALHARGLIRKVSSGGSHVVLKATAKF